MKNPGICLLQTKLIFNIGFRIRYMGKSKKFYVVWVGNQPGIYDNWNDCHAQVKAFPNAKYRSYKTREEAEEAFKYPYTVTKSKKKKSPISSPKGIIQDSLSVDAACSGNPGVMEYRGVMTGSHEEIFRKGPFTYGTNNVGEFLALVHGLAYLKKIGDEKTPIYSDSRTAMVWLSKKRANTKVDLASKNPSLLKLLRRAEKWLKENTYRTVVYKWDTKNWGEIPADFGRK